MKHIFGAQIDCERVARVDWNTSEPAGSGDEFGEG